MDRSGTASSRPSSPTKSPEPSTRTASSGASAQPPADANLEFLQLVMEGLKRCHEDEDFRKEVAKHIS